MFSHPPQQTFHGVYRLKNDIDWSKRMANTIFLWRTYQNKNLNILRKYSSLQVYNNMRCTVTMGDFRDIFTTMIEMKWRWLIIFFTLSFLLSWLFFAALYYLVMYIHHDFDHQIASNESWTPCISNTKNFISVFMFSLETQQTIGYGSRYDTMIPHDTII